MINEQFFADSVNPEIMDFIWEKGFRHFGTIFFRYDLNVYNKELVDVVPLRLVLDRFQLTQSQTKIIKKNKHFKFEFKDVEIDEERIKLFEIHKSRFKENVPESIYSFLGEDPRDKPCEVKECCVYDDGKIIAASYLDIGMYSTSSVYGYFHPEYSKYSLGIYTMLLEIEYSNQNVKKFWYPGYVYQVPSFYDYKKQFVGLEFYDWKGNWKEFRR